MQCGSEGCKHWQDCESISQTHCVKAWKNLVRLWRAQKLCDVVITVEGERFLCHGIVPASTSPFFRKAFLKRNEMSAMDSILCEKEVVVDFMKKPIFEKVGDFIKLRFYNDNLTIHLKPLLLSIFPFRY